jgi:hypothetical protein
MKNPSRLAWLFFGIITVSTLFNLVTALGDREPFPMSLELIDLVIGNLIPVAFAFLGAIILSRQPRNVIGWLLMMPALLGILPVHAYIRSFTGAPLQPPILLMLSLWFVNWSWLLLIYPIFFILVLFPTGQPPSPRWRWLIVAGLVMMAIFLFLITFSQSFEATELGWSVPNPIGLLQADVWEKYFIILWPAALFSLTLLSVASLFFRYRGAATVERTQIKWLLYACALFAAVYIPLWWISDLKTILNEIWNLLFSLSILAIPAAITAAILRYRLFDIDVIIRKTLVYAALTATLGLVFFGGVALLQQVVGRITGTEDSPVAIVISTLLIAALFSPLRRRIQDFIDRRFYRQKYNAEQALADFADTARNETDLEALTGKLLEVVSQTMQPEQASLWLRPSRDRTSGLKS